MFLCARIVNFPSNAVVNVDGYGNPFGSPVSLSLNAAGTRIVVQYVYSPVLAPVTLQVTVTNPSANPSGVSNVFYLPLMPPAPVEDYSISASPAALTVARGSSGTSTLTLTPIAGFSGNVSLSCSGEPSNTTCSVSPSSVTLNGTNSSQATVTVTVKHNASTGTQTLSLKGTSGSLTHTTTVTLTID